MTQEQFLQELASRLKALPADERQEILQDYREHFQFAQLDGQAEVAAAKALGEPRMLAKEILAEYHLTQAEEQRSPRHLLRAAFALVSLGLLNLVFVLPPLFGAGLAVLVLYIVAVALALSPLGLFFLPSDMAFSTGDWLLVVLAAAVACGLGLLFVIGFTRGLRWLFGKLLLYLRWQLKLAQTK